MNIFLIFLFFKVKKIKMYQFSNYQIMKNWKFHKKLKNIIISTNNSHGRKIYKGGILTPIVRSLFLITKKNKL